MNKATIAEYTKEMFRPQVWGTHVEMIAAATLFHAPIYYCRKDAHGKGYHWEVCHPLSTSAQRPLKLPHLSEHDPLYSANHPTHFELLHKDMHYDCIVSSETKKLCQSPPKLFSTHTYIDLLV